MTIHFAELAGWKFGHWMPGDFEDVTVPKLEEVLKFA